MKLQVKRLRMRKAGCDWIQHQLADVLGREFRANLYTVKVFVTNMEGDAMCLFVLTCLPVLRFVELSEYNLKDVIP